MTEADLALFERIDDFRNPAASKERLAHLKPIEFEGKRYADQTAVEQVNPKPRQPAQIRQPAPPAHRGSRTTGPFSPPAEEGGHRRRSEPEETRTPTLFPKRHWSDTRLFISLVFFCSFREGLPCLTL
ncbi:hypothetical protein [Streptomyces sp. NWU339]|uniref:hypothetical protein n=1 Tax=Streptomyces sp. NWU339 TaxID=2185284 RepID=UPI0011B51050|nr:hypothetical protein [Streptomyces sp. NWU339]